MYDQDASHPPLESNPVTPLQRAIQARALATLENAERQPKPTRQRKILVAVLVVITLSALLLLIDFSVRVMHHILLIWYPEPTPTQMQLPKPIKPLGPDEPYYITVDPPPDEAATTASSSM